MTALDILPTSVGSVTYNVANVVHRNKSITVTGQSDSHSDTWPSILLLVLHTHIPRTLCDFNFILIVIIAAVENRSSKVTTGTSE